MDYTKHYNLLMKKAKTREKPQGYLEIHHIIPKSEGGKNEDSNLVFLTAREHFLAHWLLYKENPTQSRTFAFYCMHSFRKTSSREYQKVKEKAKTQQSSSFGKPILQVTSEGKIIKEYKSAVHAKKLNNFRNSVNQAANGKLASAYGYIWIWKDELHLLNSKLELYSKHRDKTGKKISKQDIIDKRAQGRSKPVLQFTINGDFIKKWNSSTEVYKILGIYIVPHLRRRAKTAGGFIWEYYK